MEIFLAANRPAKNAGLLGFRHRRADRKRRRRRRWLGGRGHRRRIKDRGLVAAMQRQKIERDAGQEEQDGQDRGGAGQSVGRAAGREQSAHAAATAYAQRTALGTLQQDKENQRDRNQQFGDEQQGLHGSNPRAFGDPVKTRASEGAGL